MKSLILVKHSLPEVVENIPAREWKLSVEGRMRAQSLAERLIEYQPEVISSSLEIKAQETAHILADHFGLEYEVFEGLHEHDRSKSPFYSKDQFQILVQEFFDKPDILVFGSETAHQVLSRFQVAVDSVLSSYQEKSILIVSHGTVISLFVSHLTRCDGYFLWKELGLPSFVLIDIESQSLIKTVNLE